VHVGLGQDDGARRAQPGDDEGVLPRLRAFERQRAAGGWQVGGIVVVLENDGHAVQWAELSAMGEAGIEEVGRGQRTSVQCQYGIELRSLLVVGRDAVEVSLDELVAAQAVIAERLLDLRNRRSSTLKSVARTGVATAARQAAKARMYFFIMCLS